MSGIKSMYADSSVCDRVKGDESEQFRIYSGVIQGCITSPWLLNGWSDEGREDGDRKEGSELLEDGREWRLPGPLYADGLVLYGELEEDLRVMVGQFAEVCRRRGLKVNAVR